MKIRSIKFNFAMNAATTALNFLFPLITFPYVSRVLMPTGYGAAEFALSAAQLFSLVALLGVNTYGIRECAKVRDDEKEMARVFQELFLIVGVWTVVVTAAFYLSALMVPRFAEGGSVFLAAGLLIPLTTIGFQWFMSANEQYAFMAVRNLVVKVLVVIAMFVFVHSEGDILAWVIISVCSTGLSSLANAAYIFRNVKLCRWRDLAWRRHVKPLVVFFLMVASTAIYTMLDAVMLGYMTTDVDVGYYNVTIKIKNVFISVIAALASVLIPRATYYLAQGNEREYFKIVNLSVHAAVIYAFFAVAAGMIFSDSIINLLAGSQYGSSISMLVAVMPAVLFVSFTQITSSEILTPRNRERVLAITYGAAGTLDIVLNLVLIPRYQALGAAVATTVTECFVFVVQVVVVRRMGPLGPYLRGCGRMVVPVALSVGVLAGGRMLLGADFVSAVATVAVALAVLMVGLGIVREPLMMDLQATARRLLKR